MSRQNKNEDEISRGISINAINIVFVLVVVLFSIAILFNDYAVQQKHMRSFNLQKTLIACSDAANALKDDSDRLTLCVNTYLETKSPDEMKEYYSIIDNRLREQEVQRAENFHADCTTLRQALDLSNELAVRETDAFALIATANGTIDEAPEQVRRYQLTPEEKAMSEADMTERAHKLIHGEEYNRYKRRIYSRISNFEDQVLAGTENTLMEDTKQISVNLSRLNKIALIGNFVVIALALLLYRKVTVVLRGFVVSISKSQLMKESGTAELKYLARTFNKYVKEHNARQDELRRMAEVDALTGVASRRALEDYIMQRLNDADIEGVFIFLDIDDFKLINDTYGHDAGDAVLVQLADVINEIFESKAFVGRFGGDEFVVWLDGGRSADVDYIKEKISKINDAFEGTKRPMIITVSAGAALCKGGDKYSDVIKAADNALYDVKKRGKCGCLVCRVQNDEQILNGGVEK